MAKINKKGDARLQIMGVGVDSTELVEVLTKIDDYCKISLNSMKGGPKMIVTINPEFVMLAQKNAEFKEIINGADLAIADGVGLRLVYPELEIIPGRRIVEIVAKTSNYRTFYLGGRGGVSQKMVEKFGGDFDPGHQDIQHISESENKRIIEKINSYKPDILFVAYGAPWQEKWIWANRHMIKAKVAMGVGGSFDVLTGKLKPPPILMEKMGLEWLWRLIQEPSRWKRQLSWIRFAWSALTHL